MKTYVKKLVKIRPVKKYRPMLLSTMLKDYNLYLIDFYEKRMPGNYDKPRLFETWLKTVVSE
jgi:hypothetical protein